MQLSPGERSVLAYFPSSGRASAAVKELKEKGYENVQLDRVSRYGVKNDAEYDSPLSGRPTVTGLTLFSSDTDGISGDDTRVLMLADPSATGYGSPDYGVAGGNAFLVTVVTGEDRLERALEILKRHGGSV